MKKTKKNKFHMFSSKSVDKYHFLFYNVKVSHSYGMMLMQKTQEIFYNSVLSDEKLVSMVCDGCPDAFDALATRYVSKIRAIARFYSACGIEAEDLAQEGMIGLFQAVRSYNAGVLSSFGTYARTCIDKRIISAVRTTFRKKRIPKFALIYIDDLALCDSFRSFREDDTNPETAFFQQFDLHLLRQFLSDSLSTFEYGVLLSFLDGNSYDEMAKKLSTTSKAVDNALWRIRRKLRCTVS